MTKSKKNAKEVGSYSPPRLSTYGTVVGLTASGTRNEREDPNDPGGSSKARP